MSQLVNGFNTLEQVSVERRRPRSPGLYRISLLTNQDSWPINENKDICVDFKDGNQSIKDPGRGGCRRPEEPCLRATLALPLSHTFEVEEMLLLRFMSIR